jgi:hypothetical protein
MKGGEGEGVRRATPFLLACWNYWGHCEVFGGKFPLTDLDKTLGFPHIAGMCLHDCR